MVKNSTMTINFVEFKRAMTTGTKTAGKVTAYYKDFMRNRINVAQFCKVLEELDREHKFILGRPNYDNIICSLQEQITSESRRTYEKKA